MAESLFGSDRVALEVTGSCWEVVRILEPYVDRVVVVSPDDTGIANARAKTDRLDARALATLLWRGELDAVWVPDERCRVLRRRLARREQLVHARTRAKNEIQAVLQRRLQGKPPCSDLFGVKGRSWLASLELPVEERESVSAGIRHIEFLDWEIREVERLIAEQALAWPEIHRLMTVPGVNLICAATFIAAVGEINRFANSRKLVAYLGLDPKVRQSGEAPARSGRISKRGSPSARWALVEAAWIAVRQPGPMHAFYERTRARRGHGKAVVASARKLAVLFWCMLTRSEDYAPRSVRSPAPTRRSGTPSASSLNRPRSPTSGSCKTSKLEHLREKWARARHRSAHKLGPRRAKLRGRLKAPDVCASLRQSPAPTHNLTSRDNANKTRRRSPPRKYRQNRGPSSRSSATEAPRARLSAAGRKSRLGLKES